MSTKRARITPRRVDRAMPEWARAYVETGELPTYDTPEHDQWVGWAFFDESIPGLPDERTPEGKALAWGRYRADQAS